MNIDKTDYKQIIFIASYPKSGSTWLRCFLDAYFMNEVDINELLSTITDDFAPAYDIGDGQAISDYNFEIQQFMRPMALFRLVKQYLATDKNIPFYVKTHNANLLINGYELIPATLTKAVIFIVRDPKDVLPSFSKHMGVDMDKGLEWMQDKFRMLNGSTKATDFISSWKDHTNSWLNPSAQNVKYFRYEDMISDPIYTFSEMLKHSGVEPDRERVIKSLELVKLSKLKKQEKESGFSEHSKHAKGQFFGAKHKQINPKQSHTIEKVCGRIMKKLGYIDTLRKAS